MHGTGEKRSSQVFCVSFFFSFLFCRCRCNNTALLPPQFLLYCEGTRFTEKKHQISMQVAQSKGLPVLKYHLLPRTKGFTTTLQCLKDTGGVYKHTHTKFKFTQVFCYFCLWFYFIFSCLTVTAVYDVTLNFKDNQTPTLLGIVNGKKYKADMSVRWVLLTASIYFESTSVVIAMRFTVLRLLEWKMH